MEEGSQGERWEEREGGKGREGIHPCSSTDVMNSQPDSNSSYARCNVVGLRGLPCCSFAINSTPAPAAVDDQSMARLDAMLMPPAGAMPPNHSEMEHEGYKLFE